MSIPALIQTYDEVRRLALAGSMVAAGDFRLKKLVAPLEQVGQKAPVFMKVAEAVKRLAESTEQTSAVALLELAALVSSILYTQGETGVDGEWTPLPTSDRARPQTQASARVLKPLLEALTTTGSGRLEIIRDGVERGAFHDFRLIAPALGALDDSYADVSELVAREILPIYGAAIFPELEATFDPRGKGGQVRRLLLMHQIDPAAARPHILRSLDEGSPEVRVAAIGCLGDSPDDLPFLLEQVKARAKDVRSASLKALGRCGTDEAARVLGDAIRGDDLALAVEPLRRSRHPAVVGSLLDRAEEQYDALIAGKEKDPKKLGRQIERMRLLLDCLRGREDRRTEQFLLTMFGNVARLAAIKGTPGGNDVVERLVAVMATGAPGVRDALIDAHQGLPAESLGRAFVAARMSRPPAEVFALFSPYVTARVDEKKKHRDPAWMKRETIIAEFLRPARSRRFGADEPAPLAELDPRWLDLAIKLGRAELVQALAVPEHAGARAFLTRLFREKLGRARQEFELAEILDAMIRAEHPDATDSIIELIKLLAGAKSPYGYSAIPYWFSRLIPRLPRAEALPKLEALLPTLPEKMVDQLIDCLTGLKQH